MIERFLDLAEIETFDGAIHRFVIGTAGIFTDIDGVKWVGSQLLTGGDREIALNGKAPEGELSFSYIQDPDAEDLQSKMAELGSDYVAGKKIRFYQQQLDVYSAVPLPIGAPELYMTRTMRAMTFSQSGVQNRSITVTFESLFENRRAAKMLTYTTVDHALITGAENPSLAFMPKDDYKKESLY